MNKLKPALNSLVEIFLPGQDRGLPSRVEDISDSYLDISAPPLPATFHPEPGQEMALFWRDQRGMYQVSSRLIGTLSAPHRLWRVETVADAVKFQRRRYARAETLIDVEINFVDRDPPMQILARAIDISEGGLRCRTDEQVTLTSGEIVEASFVTDGVMRTVSGSILRKDWVKGLSDFVVVLIEPVLESVATAVRREVFRVQSMHRRTHRGEH